MRKIKIILVGQPNVGKSSLLNSLVGPKVTVSNYPGTTLEIFKAEKKCSNAKIEFQDAPGIYSISEGNEGEKVAKRALLDKKISGAIVVIDAVSLERSLYMVLQILETGVPIILALNFVEEGEKKGIKIDCDKLAKILGVPVVSFNPLTKRGVSKIVTEVLKIKKVPKRIFKIRYDDHLEQGIRKLIPQIKKTYLPKRFIALRVLEKDRDFYQYLKDKKTLREIKKDLKKYHPQLAEDISIARFGTASLIARETTRFFSLKKEKKWEERLDKILLNKILGPVIMGLFLIFIFGILLFLGNLIQNFLMGLTEKLSFFLDQTEFSIFSLMLVQGLKGLAMGIAIALPYVFLFYLILGLLEDIGILSRFIVNAQRFLKKIGLPGESFIPLALGLGCTAPAVRSTRLLPSRKEQFYTASFFAFIPCSSRIAIIMGVVGFYGGWVLALAVFASLLLAGLIWAWVMKIIIRPKISPLLIELPSYRRPLIKNVLSKSWLRMKSFVYIVMPLLVLGGIAYSLLDILGFTVAIVKPCSVIMNWLGLPAESIVPLAFGFLQKDLTGAMLLSVFGSDGILTLTSLQLYTFGLVATIGIPCIIAWGMLSKEFNFKKASILTLATIIYGFLFAGILGKFFVLF